MKALESFGTADPGTIRRQITGLRQEIALVKQKRSGLDAAIDNRENRIARLEAQLALTGSTAQPALAMIAARR